MAALRAVVALAVSLGGVTALLGMPGDWIIDYRSFLATNLTSAAAVAPLLRLHWMAPFLSSGGYCSEATAFALGLQAAGVVKLSIEQHGDSYNHGYVSGLPLEEQARLGRLLQAPRAAARSISVCHSEPGAWQVSAALPQRYSTAVCPLPGAAVRVGRTMFESDRTPEGWADRLNALDEIWVPTRFQADVFAAGGVSREKLLVVPEPVDTAFFDPARYRGERGGALAAAAPAEAASSEAEAASAEAEADLAALGLPRRNCTALGAPGSTAACPYRFLSVGKFERRKGFDVLLASYLAEFTGAGGAPPFVELLILTSAYHSTRDFDAAVASMMEGELACGPGVTPAQVAAREATCVLPAHAARPRARVRLLHDVPQALLPGVYAACDAFVLASRGEGWGRPHVEAMAMAMPVIATRWSGPSEFLSEANGYPLRHTGLEPLPDGPFAGHRMAAPDPLHLRQLLREVLEQQPQAAARGAAARRDMLALYSPAAVARFVAHQVARLSAAAAAAAAVKRDEL